MHMAIWQYLLLLAAGLVLVFTACLLPEKFFRGVIRISLNALAGLALLLLINVFSGYTGLVMPLNGLTVAVSGLLGAPGVAVLAVIAAI
jgi:inhibitor of the pro-sigma K processing machinery